MSPTHDIQVAYFKIYQDNNLVYVDFVFEKEDIIQMMNARHSTLTNQGLQKYLQEHFSLRIDNQEINLFYGNINISNKHIQIQGSLSVPIQTIHTIDIMNTCLLELTKHSNIIKLRIHDLERDFLMNSDRTSIRVQY